MAAFYIMYICSTKSSAHASVVSSTLQKKSMLPRSPPKDTEALAHMSDDYHMYVQLGLWRPDSSLSKPFPSSAHGQQVSQGTMKYPLKAAFKNVPFQRPRAPPPEFGNFFLKKKKKSTFASHH